MRGGPYYIKIFVPRGGVHPLFFSCLNELLLCAEPRPPQLIQKSRPRLTLLTCADCIVARQNFEAAPPPRPRHHEGALVTNFSCASCVQTVAGEDGEEGGYFSFCFFWNFCSSSWYFWRQAAPCALLEPLASKESVCTSV